jgi:hypothetical protein
MPLLSHHRFRYVIGQNPEVDGTQAKTPLLLVTGSLDSMLPYSREAEKVFKEAGHHVELGTNAILLSSRACGLTPSCYRAGRGNEA